MNFWLYLYFLKFIMFHAAFEICVGVIVVEFTKWVHVHYETMFTK